MTIESRYVLVVSMDVEPAQEDLFNEVYDTEHVPFLLEVPGVHACTRARGAAFQFAVGGEIKDVAAPSPAYTAIYEVDGPEVLTSPEWQAAVEKGRWPSVRPYCSNRHHALYKVR